MNEFKWYVVRAISGKEKKAKEYLEAELRSENKTERVPQIIIPMEKVMTVRDGKKIVKERNSLPGYMIIEAALDPDLVLSITSVTYIIGFLGGENPQPMRDSEVRRLLGKVDEMAESGEQMQTPFTLGESVKVTDGPFNEFTGVIDEIYEEKKKLRVMVKIFGRRTPLELNYTQVEKISA
jgi:transcriptional antiterminator NusG